MEKNNKEEKEAKQFILLNLELNENSLKEIEKEKIIIEEEIVTNKKYLIKEVLENGESLLEEIALKEKRSFWDKIMDFIFK